MPFFSLKSCLIALFCRRVEQHPWDQSLGRQWRLGQPVSLSSQQAHVKLVTITGHTWARVLCLDTRESDILTSVILTFLGHTWAWVFFGYTWVGYPSNCETGHIWRHAGCPVKHVSWTSLHRHMIRVILSLHTWFWGILWHTWTWWFLYTSKGCPVTLELGHPWPHVIRDSPFF